MRSLLIVLIAFLFSLEASGQYTSISVPVLDEPMNSRNFALGNSLVSFTHNSLGSYINPASVSHEGLPTLGYFFYENDGISGHFNTRTKNVYAGFSAKKFDIALSYLDFRSILDDNLLILDEPFRENVLKLSTAYKFDSGLRVGIGLNYLESDIGDNQIYADREYSPATSFFVDLGVQYQKVYQKGEDWELTPSFGASLTNFGQPVSYYNDEDTDPLPSKLKIGSGLTAEYGVEIYGMKLLRVLGSLAVSKYMVRQEMKVIENNGQSDTVYVAMNAFEALYRSWGTYTWYDGASYQEASLGQQLIFHSGIEVVFLETLALRFGYQKASEVNLPYTVQTGGFGINLGYLAFDYTRFYYPEGRLSEKGYTWDITARIPLGGNRPKSILNQFFK